MNAAKCKQLLFDLGTIDQMNSLQGMRGKVFQDDGDPLHRTKETKEALNAVCSADLHSPANSADLTPIEQMWWTGKDSINREQCNTPEELSVQAEAALTAITMESLNGMVESYSTRLRVILALSGQCLNRHRDVMRDLRLSRQTPEGIAHAREAQTESLPRFVEGSRALLTALSSGDPPRCYHKWIARHFS
jgi:hypothetical protein